MGNSSSNNPNQQITTTNQPPGYVLPFARSYEAGLFNQLFPGGQMQQNPVPPSQVQGFTPDQILGMNQGSQLAAQGSPANQSENQMLNQTMQGKYLDPSTNPWLQQTFNDASRSMVNQYQDATQPGIQAQFAQAGNFGSSAQADAQDAAKYGLGQNLSSLASSIYGGNYQQERQNQLQAAGLIPGAISAQFLAPSELQSIGGEQQQFGQNVLNTAQQNAIQNNVTWPQQVFQELGQSLGLATGNAGQQTQTEPNPYAQNPGIGQLAAGGGLGLLGLLGLIP